MKTIERHQIERLFPRQTFDRGMKYYLNGRVNGLSYNRQKQEWFAEVEGSESYYVEVGLDKLHKGTIKTYCECPAFDTYKSCKHLVAVLLEISDQKQHQIDSRVTSQFIEGLLSMNQPDILTEKVPMQVEYYIRFDSGKVWIELKTGVEYCYVVQQIRDFLTHVFEQRPYTFTHKFSFNPEEHYFLQQDEELLKELYTYIQTGDLFTDRGYYPDNAYDRRKILIPPLNFPSLLEKLGERKSFVIDHDEQYEQLQLTYDKIPFSFTIDEKDEIVVLKTDGVTNGFFSPTYKFFFHEGTFYFPTDAQLKVVEEIDRLRLHQQELPLEAEQVDIFFSEALPTLKQVTDIQITEELTKEIVEYPLRAELYLEEQDGMIVGKLHYIYGNYTVNPFLMNEKTDAIIIRDIEKEQTIMSFIEQANFHYNGKQLYLDMENDDALYEFLYEILPMLDEYVDVFLTDDIQNMLIIEEPVPIATVQVEAQSNLLEIGFDVTGVNEEEIAALLDAVIEKKRYYRLNSGAMVSLETDEFDSIRDLFADLRVNKTDIQENKLTLPAYRSMQIDEYSKTKMDYDPSFTQLLAKIKQPERQVYPLPNNLQATLRSYQETGFQWFKSLSDYHLGGILADDMGLGKTVQTIAYLLSEQSDKPHLVIVPSSVVYNWRNECRKFAPDLKVAILTGQPEERKQLMGDAMNADVWITSYGIVRQDIDLYKEVSFQTLILDEAQNVKNYFTKTSRAVREIQAERRFALSGTPIENSIDELWAIFQVILPGFFPPLKEFRKMARKKIASLTRPFILRRVKEDVLKELPEKIESVHVSDLTKEQKELYVGYLQQLQTETTTSIANNQFQQNRMKILAGLTRLRQICCHPSLFIENYEGRSGKLDELIDMVQTLIANGKRMLIFSQFTSMHALIIDELQKLGIDYFYLHGQTPAEERVEMSEAFNGGEKNVFLISLRAGGTGLNLTGADTVILFDLWWNPAVEDQAAGRAHRFGQKNVVQVIRFITDGTIEEKIYELQQKKRELIDQVIQPGETMLSSLSEDDIRELLSI